MAEQYTLQSPAPTPEITPQEPTKPFLSSNTLRLLIGGGVLLLFVSFFAGFFVRGLFSTNQSEPTKPVVQEKPTPLPTPKGVTPTPSTFSEIPASSIQFLPGKQYFEDTYSIISKKQPYKTLILTVARIEQERNYAQYTKVNYFDGQEWLRRAVTTTTTNSNVATNTLLQGWQTSNNNFSNNPTIAEIELEERMISFSSPNLQNEISVESLPGSTKFIYQGEGAITIDGGVEEVYILHTRSYSFNAIDLAFFNSPENLTSNFIAFWDEEGEFYYVDTHTTKNPTSAIQTRSVGIKENARGVVSKTERLNLNFQQRDGVNEFVTRFEAPISEQLRLTFYRALNKAENRTYSWTLTNATGSSVKAEGRTVKGIGIVEYIRPAQ